MRRRTGALLGVLLAAAVTVGGGHLATAAGASVGRPGGAHRSPAQHRAGADGRLLPRAAGHDAPGAAAACGRSDVPQRPRRRLAVLPVARGDLHRPPAPPDRGVHQHRERPGAPDRRLPGVRPQRQHGQGVQRRAAEEWLHHRVHRQVHERLQHVHQHLGENFAPAKIPGWDVFNAVLSGGYHEWGFRTTYLDKDGMVRMRHTRKPPRSAPAKVLDRAYATNVMSRCADTSCASTATRRSPTSSRSPPTARTPRCRRPTPTTRRSRRPSPTARPRGTRRAATAARSRAAGSRSATSRGTPTRGTTTRRPTCAATGPPPLLRPGTPTRSRSATRSR